MADEEDYIAVHVMYFDGQQFITPESARIKALEKALVEERIARWYYETEYLPGGPVSDEDRAKAIEQLVKEGLLDGG